jgi:hypothetical protein
MTEDAISSTEDVVEQIKRLLAARPPGMQGVILANLLALFIAGHPPAARDKLLDWHVQMVRKLVPAVEAELFGEHGYPG